MKKGSLVVFRHKDGEIVNIGITYRDRQREIRVVWLYSSYSRTTWEEGNTTSICTKELIRSSKDIGLSVEVIEDFLSVILKEKIQENENE